jgi:hypothetical protein
MKKALSVLVVTLLIASFGYAASKKVPEVTGAEELVEEKGPFQGTWVHPDADMSKYSKLYLWQAAFQFREGGKESGGTTASQLSNYVGPYAVTDDSKEKFEEVVSEAFVKELNRSKLFEVVDEVGPGTLIVRAVVGDIVSNVPADYRGTANIHLASVGQATFLFELIDSETGVIQARTGERREIQPPGSTYEVSRAPANAATIWNDVSRWARAVAHDLRKALEKSKKKASK